MKSKVLIMLVLLLIPLIYLSTLWNSFPPNVPVHFDFKGNVDRYGSKTEVLLITLALTFLTLVIFLLFSYIHILNPKIASADNKTRMQKMAVAVVLFMVIIQCWLLYTIHKGQLAFSVKYILIAVSLLFAVIGNYMPNLKPNYVAGFRLPWTLQNADNWKRTHDVAGKLWFSGGIAAAIICIILPFKLALFIVVLVLVILLTIPAIYSYRLFNKSKSS